MTARESSQTNSTTDNVDRSPSPVDNRHIWLATVTGGVLAVLVVVLWRILDVREDAHVERAVRMAAEGSALLIETDIQGRLADLSRMDRRSRLRPNLSRQEWEDDVTAYMADHPGLRAIAWVDETDRVQWVVPWEGTEKAHGIHLGFEPERKRILAYAREQRRPVLSRILQLLDGHEGFLALLVMDEGTGFTGALVAAFRLREWLDSVFSNLPVAGISLSVLQDERTIYEKKEPGLPTVPSPFIVDSQVHLVDHQWVLRAEPSAEFEADIRSPYPTIVLLGGLILAVITGVAVGLGSLARQRAAGLSALNKELTRHIRAQRKAEKSLAKREAQFRLLAEASPSMIFLTDANGEVIYVNDRLQRITGLPEGSWNGDGWLDSTHLDDKERIYHRWKQNVKSGTPWQEEYRVQLSDGRTIWLLELAVPIRGDTGKLTGYIGTSTDITTLKHAEQDAERLRSELAHAVRVTSLGEIATGLAHEINQPLAAISNYCELARDMVRAEDSLPEDLGYALEQAVLQAHRAGSIVQSIRNFLRRGELDLSRLELDAIVREALLVISAEAHDKGVRIELNLPEDPPAFDGNRLQLVQVLVNLLLNSIEAMVLADSRPKEILIGAKTHVSGSITVSVQDTGPGLDPERAKSLFDAFETDKADGMGMGLSICRTIVEAHGGNIRAGAGNTGGAEFSFTLPAAGIGVQR